MILTCPQCETRYLLPALSLAPEGRHVKCSNCAETWFQLPDPEELEQFEQDKEQNEGASFDDHMQDQDFEDIPDAVKPIPEGSSVPALPDEEAERSLKDTLISSAVSGVGIFVIITILLLVVHTPVMNAFPSMRSFYGAFGLSAPLAGEGVVFDKLSAKAEKDGESEVIVLEGQVINLTSEQQKLPYIEAAVKNAHGEDIEKWIVELPVKELEKEDTESFSSRYTLSQEGGESVHVRFVLKSKAPKVKMMDDEPKTVSKDGDNTQAPHADDHAH